MVETREMGLMAREDLLAQTFVQLADSLVDDFDIIDLLTVLADRCVELVDADAAGILVADANGNLRVMAASSEQARLLELFQLQNEEGPCLEAHATGQPVIHADLRDADERWPRFAPEARLDGFASVYALPLRLRAVVIGALNLFRREAGAMPDADAKLAQALADVASIAILQYQATRESQTLAGQLQHALDSRVSIEQAKGMIAERAQVDMDEAFVRLRAYARSSRRQLTSVATEIVGGTLSLEDVISIA
jgi:transcriptional regulator with GAF, ATPase, and Fis domain